MGYRLGGLKLRGHTLSVKLKMASFRSFIAHYCSLAVHFVVIRQVFVLFHRLFFLVSVV
jgi:hypothetical protein